MSETTTDRGASGEGPRVGDTWAATPKGVKRGYIAGPHTLVEKRPNGDFTNTTRDSGGDVAGLIYSESFKDGSLTLVSRPSPVEEVKPGVPQPSAGQVWSIVDPNGYELLHRDEKRGGWVVRSLPVRPRTYDELMREAREADGVPELPWCSSCETHAMLGVGGVCVKCYARRDVVVAAKMDRIGQGIQAHVVDPPWVPSCDIDHDLPSATEFGERLPERRGSGS